MDRQIAVASVLWFLALIAPAASQDDPCAGIEDPDERANCYLNLDVPDEGEETLQVDPPLALEETQAYPPLANL